MAVSTNSSEMERRRWSTAAIFPINLKTYNFVIFIEKPDGSFLKVTMKPSSTIFHLKKDIARQTGFDETKMCLIFMGKCLKNEKTILECGVSSCSVLEMITTKQIGIENKIGEMIHLEFSPHETVASIKSKMTDTFGIPVKRQCLLHKGKQLKDYRQLCTYKIRNGDQLHIASSIQIFIRNLRGKTRVFVVEPFVKIESVKKLVENKEGIPSKWINLSYAGKLLESHRTLSDYNIQNESTINMNIRLCCPSPKNPTEEDGACGGLLRSDDVHNSTMIQC